MKFKELQVKDRPRERLIEKGVNALSDAELLAIILRTGNCNKDVIDLANDILKKYPFNKLKDLIYEELIKIEGIKSAKASSILALFEIARRSFIKDINDICFKNSNDIYQYIYNEIADESNEVLIIIYLDVKLRLIKKEKFHNYDPNSINIPIKRIMQVALNLNVSNIVIIHNHPSGDLTPSKSDIISTKDILKLFNEVGIEIIDHLIISNEGYYSFAEKGLLYEDYEYNNLGDIF